MRKYWFGKPYKLNGKWRCEARYVGPDGKQHKISTYLKDPRGCFIPSEPDSNRGQRSAEAAALEWQLGLDAVSKDEEKKDALLDITLGEAVQRHINDSYKSGRIKYATRNAYLVRFREIPPRYLKKRVVELTPRDMLDIQLEVTSRQLACSSVSQAMSLISSSINALIRLDGLDIRNPCDRLPPIKTLRPSPNSLDMKGIRRLNRLLDEMEDIRLRDAVWIAIHTGMRIGEICALRFCDIDFDQSMIHVRHSIARGEHGTKLGSTKTQSSLRDIPMDQELESLLLRRKAFAMAGCRSAGAQFSEDFFVLYHQNHNWSVPLTKWVEPPYLTSMWHTFAQKNGFYGSQGRLLKFHDLRHTYATIAVASGTDIESISHILGHSKAGMTLNIYADALPESKRAAALKIGSFMSSRDGIDMDSAS